MFRACRLLVPSVRVSHLRLLATNAGSSAKRQRTAAPTDLAKQEAQLAPTMSSVWNALEKLMSQQSGNNSSASNSAFRMDEQSIRAMQQIVTKLPALTAQMLPKIEQLRSALPVRLPIPTGITELPKLWHQAQNDFALYAELTELASLQQFARYNSADIAAGLTLMVAANAALAVAGGAQSKLTKAFALAALPQAPQRELWRLPWSSTASNDKQKREESQPASSAETDADPVDLDSVARYCGLADAAYSNSAAEFAQRVRQLGLSPPSSSSESEGEFPVVGNWKADINFKRAHFFFADHARGELIVGVRGSKDFHDVFTNVATLSEPFLTGSAHAGMVRSARELVTSLLTFLRSDQCKRWVEQYQLSKITFVGHSLGGGTAALATLLLRDMAACGDLRGLPLPLSRSSAANNEGSDSAEAHDANIRCYSFGAPACVSGDFGEFERRHIHAFILGDDIVPRLSAANVKQAREDLLLYLEKGAAALVEVLVKRTFGTTEPVLSPGRMRCVGELFHLSVLPSPPPSKDKKQQQQQQQLKQQPSDSSDAQQSQTFSFSWKDLNRLVQQTLQAGANKSSQQQQQQPQQQQPASSVAIAPASTASAAAAANNAVNSASSAGILALLAALPFAGKKEPPKRVHLQVELRKTNPNLFVEICFSRNMIAHHFCTSYEEAIRALNSRDRDSSRHGQQS